VRLIELLDVFSQLGQSFILNLANALARDSEFLANFFERFLVVSIEPEAMAQNPLFAHIQLLQHFVNKLHVILALKILQRRMRILIRHDVGDSIAIVIAQRRIE